MRIYTKSGDKGETGLLGGKRVSKSHRRIAAIGGLDELNAMIGVLLAQHPSPETAVILRQAQDDIFAIGAELADPDGKYTVKRIGREHVKFLEGEIDKLEARLPRLKNFILPGGTELAAYMHLARAICRRAERSFARLNQKESIRPQILMYINRLSDLLFMLAREDLYHKKIPEIPWVSR